MYMSTAARLNMRSTEKKMLKYYDDGGAGRGNCTWGIGTKAHNGPCSKAELARVVLDADIEREFSSRLKEAERGVERNVKIPLTQAQFDALVRLAYNVGIRGSVMTTAKQKRKGKWVQVVLPGLVSRRMEESAPFRNLSQAPARSAAK